MTLFLVRHAHAGSRQEWTGDDRLRPLSARGRAQADAIADQLHAYEPIRILSSPTVRCRETVGPLASRLHLDVTDDERLLEGAGAADVRSVLDEVKRDTVVLCSHGDVVPALLDELVVRGMARPEQLRWAKASTWIVEGDGGDHWGVATYLAPPC